MYELLLSIKKNKGVAWSYEGERGPHSWHKLPGADPATRGGLYQSPININTEDTSSFLEDRGILRVRYQSSAPAWILHTGKTVQINFPAGDIVISDALGTRGAEKV